MIMKRTAMPKFWPLERKTTKFTISPMPATHSKERSFSLGVVLRDVLKIAEDMSEAKRILNGNFVKIDGKIRKDRKFPVGLMDVVTVGNEHYRILPGKSGLYFHRISDDECRIKLSKVRNKTCVSGKVQLNLYDGKNIFANDKNNNCKTGDVLVINIENNEIKQVLSLKKGSVVLLTGGISAGSTGIIEDIAITRSPQPNKVVVKTNDKIVTIPIESIYVIGTEKPVISLPKEIR